MCIRDSLSDELRGPAVSFRLGDKTNLGLMTRVRSGFQIAEASERIMAIARLGLANKSNLQDLGYLALFASQSENRFNVSSQAYSEWAMALGQTLLETDAFRVKGGVTVKRYFGYAGGYMQNRSLNYRLLPDPANANACLLYTSTPPKPRTPAMIATTRNMMVHLSMIDKGSSE